MSYPYIQLLVVVSTMMIIYIGVGCVWSSAAKLLVAFFTGTSSQGLLLFLPKGGKKGVRLV
jgi:hypothetical protein